MSVCRSSSVHSSLNYSTLRRWIRISSRTFRSPRLPSRGVRRVVKRNLTLPFPLFLFIPCQFISFHPILSSLPLNRSPCQIQLRGQRERSELQGKLGRAWPPNDFDAANDRLWCQCFHLRKFKMDERKHGPHNCNKTATQQSFVAFVRNALRREMFDSEERWVRPWRVVFAALWRLSFHFC